MIKAKVITVIPERLGYQGIRTPIEYEWVLHVCLTPVDVEVESVDGRYAIVAASGQALSVSDEVYHNMTSDVPDVMERVDKLYTEFYDALGWNRYADKYCVPVIYEGRVIAYPKSRRLNNELLSTN